MDVVIHSGLSDIAALGEGLVGGVVASVTVVGPWALGSGEGLDHILAGSPSVDLSIDAVASDVLLGLTVFVVMAAVVLVLELMESSAWVGLGSIHVVRLLCACHLGDWRGVMSGEAMNFRVHASLGDVLLVVTVMLFVVVLVSRLVKGRVLGARIATIGVVRRVFPLPLVEWWKGAAGEAMDFRVHASLGDIALMVAVVLVLPGLVKGGLLCACVTSIRNMCLGTSSLFSDWGGVVGCEAVNFCFHPGLTNISVVMVLL